jgi:hypothetical protein
MSMINRNFARLLMMGVFSRVCSRVIWGLESLYCRVLELLVGDSGSFFWGRWYRDGKRSRHGPWRSSYVSLHVSSSNIPNFM